MLFRTSTHNGRTQKKSTGELFFIPLLLLRTRNHVQGELSGGHNLS